MKNSYYLALTQDRDENWEAVGQIVATPVKLLKAADEPK